MLTIKTLQLINCRPSDGGATINRDPCPIMNKRCSASCWSLAIHITISHNSSRNNNNNKITTKTMPLTNSRPCGGGDNQSASLPHHEKKMPASTNDVQRVADGFPLASTQQQQNQQQQKRSCPIFKKRCAACHCRFSLSSRFFNHLQVISCMSQSIGMVAFFNFASIFLV